VGQPAFWCKDSGALRTVSNGEDSSPCCWRGASYFLFDRRLLLGGWPAVRYFCASGPFGHQFSRRATSSNWRTRPLSGRRGFHPPIRRQNRFPKTHREGEAPVLYPWSITAVRGPRSTTCPGPKARRISLRARSVGRVLGPGLGPAVGHGSGRKEGMAGMDARTRGVRSGRLGPLPKLC